MTIKHLTGAYPAGYQVKSGVTYLDIESTASVGGSGVLGLRDTTVRIVNDGTVIATGAYGMRTANGSDPVVNGKSNHGALIEGSVTGFGGDGSTDLNNYGTIVGLGTQLRPEDAGVLLGAQATATNGSVGDTTALIQGGYGGVAGGTITNFATIVGAGIGAHDTLEVINGSKADGVALIQGGQIGLDSGFLTNYGTVVGSEYGVRFNNGGTVRNHGTILGSGAYGVGITLYGNPFVYNGSLVDPTGVIEGVKAGVYARTDGDGVATIFNYGTIEATGAGGSGVLLHEGKLTNAGRSALIEGAVGVSGSFFSTLHNYGTIRGTASGGLMLYDQSGVIINGSRQDRTALITGVGASVVSGGGDTVINYGTIQGLTITAPGSTLEVAAHSSFGTGPVTMTSGTLELIGGHGTLSGLSTGVTVSGSMATTTFNGLDALQIGKRLGGDAQFTLTGSGEIAAGETLTVYGRLTVKHDLTVTGTIGGLSNGVIALDAHATAEFASGASLLTVSFRGSPSLLELTEPSQFGSTIAGMVHHGKIDLVGIAADSAVLEAGDKLVITDGGQAVATLQLAGAFGSDSFATTSDGKGGTFISVVRGQGGADPPVTTSPAPHRMISAAASLGARLGSAPLASAGYGAHGSMLLAAPRVQTA